MITLKCCKFDNMTFGYLLEDEYEQFFNCDCFKTRLIDLDLLKQWMLFIYENNRKNEIGLLSAIIRDRSGMKINHSWYDYEEIEELLKEKI